MTDDDKVNLNIFEYTILCDCIYIYIVIWLCVILAYSGLFSLQV